VGTPSPHGTHPDATWQDATSLVLGHVARGDRTIDALASVAVVAACFPLGTLTALLLATHPIPGAMPSSTAMYFVRALTAGMFLYMALFDFRP
jgi:hypothetical protein